MFGKRSRGTGPGCADGNENRVPGHGSQYAAACGPDRRKRGADRLPPRGGPTVREEAIGSNGTDPIPPSQRKRSRCNRSDPSMVRTRMGLVRRCRVSIGDRVCAQRAAPRDTLGRSPEAFCRGSSGAGKVRSREAIGVFLPINPPGEPSVDGASPVRPETILCSIGIAILSLSHLPEGGTALRAASIMVCRRTAIETIFCRGRFCPSASEGMDQSESASKGPWGGPSTAREAPTLRSTKSRTCKICMSEAAREDAALAVLSPQLWALGPGKCSHG